MFETIWRRVGESNSCTRICNPLRNHSANSPCAPDPAALLYNITAELARVAAGRSGDQPVARAHQTCQVFARRILNG